MGFRFEWAEDLSALGLAIIDRFQFDFSVPYTHEAWRGRIRASAGVSASLDANAVAAFDREHAELRHRGHHERDSERSRAVS